MLLGYVSYRIFKLFVLFLSVFQWILFICEVSFCCWWNFPIDMQPHSIREKLGPKYASVPTDKLMENPDFYRDLLRYVDISVYHHSYIVISFFCDNSKKNYLPIRFLRICYTSFPRILLVQLTLNPTPRAILFFQTGLASYPYSLRSEYAQHLLIWLHMI